MSNVYRYSAVALTALLLGVSLSVYPDRAAAFEIFGFKLFGGDDASKVSDPVRYTATLQSTDPSLKDFLNDQSSLIADQSKPVDGDFGLAVKARDDRDRLIAALYEKSRYGGVVTVKVAGIPVDKLPPSPKFDRGKPVPVTVEVDVGPKFKLGSVHFEGDAAKLDPAQYGLTVGGDAGSALILTASGKVISDLKAEGRPLAKLTARKVVADHNTNTVEVTIAADGGPVAPIGPVTVEGASSINPQFVSEWSNLKSGESYAPDKLAKAAKRLRNLSTFSSVTVREDDKLDANGAIPIKILVSEGKQRYYGVGAQYSTDSGFGLKGYWGHRNLFGNAESLKITGEVNRLGEAGYKNLDYSASIAFAKPGAFGPASTFTSSVSASVAHPDAYSERALSAAVGASFDVTDQDTVSVGLGLDWTEATDVYGRNHYLTAMVPLTWARDTTDDKLNPTTGYRVSAAIKPSYEINGRVPFVSAEASVSGYQKIGDKGPVLAARLAAGTLAGGGNLSGIPAGRRFYAGGGGSVRGYGYQEISPRNASNQELGGRSYVLASIEARVDITDTIGMVPFLDVGSVASRSAPSFSDIRAGAGIGLRYATPFGPLRLDVAVPLKRYDGGSRYGIYAGIGQAF